MTSPLNPDKSIHQFITQSDSSKFYTPKAPFSANDLPVTQDLYRVGYYIVTVEGSSVTIDYYGSQAFSSSGLPGNTTPPLTFTKLDTFGYSLNGKQYCVAQGGSYTVVQDTYQHTTARILDGVNSETGKTNTGRPLTKVVNTGWAPDKSEILASDILTLWGMSDPAGQSSDIFTLSMSYQAGRGRPMRFGKGGCGIAARDDRGNWVDAVDLNTGGTRKFVSGPWNSGYGLGAYGVDPETRTAWAVLNHNGDFAVARTLEPASGKNK